MSKMTDSRALEMIGTGDWSTDVSEAFAHIAARLREPAGVGGLVESWRSWAELEGNNGNGFAAVCIRECANKLEALAAAPQPPAEAQPDATFAEWLATEMPAGTVIGDPAWWADRIARQYAKRCAPPSAPVPDLRKGDARKIGERWMVCTDPDTERFVGFDGQDVPPSAPVGVSAAMVRVAQDAYSACLQANADPRFGVPSGLFRPGENETRAMLEAALAKQPAAPCPHGIRHPHPCRECEDGPKIEQTAAAAVVEATPRHGSDAGDGMKYVLCKVGFGSRYGDWLLVPHADGQYVTAAKLQPFTMAILRAALAQQPAAVDESIDVLRIPAQCGLDPIVVYFEDYAPGRGRVTVACYGDAWTAAWAAMGDRSVREFVKSVDPHYLAGAMQEHSRASKARRQYADRIAAEVIRALDQPQGGA